MYSDFIKFIADPPRRTEASDTRLAIKRHDPDWDRKKQHKRDETTTTFEAEDDTQISVTAAILFLEHLLSEPEDPSPENAPSQQVTTPASQADYAAHAYEHAAEITQDETPQHIRKEEIDQNAIGKTLALLLALKDSGIDHIHIEKQSGDFLKSITKAAQDALGTS